MSSKFLIELSSDYEKLFKTEIGYDVIIYAGEGPNAKEFHVPGCEFIHNKERERTLTAKEAVDQGYVPCVRCLRKYLQTASAGRTSLEMEATSEPDIAGPKQDGGE